ncbi:MAG TPA: tetratricopeptide repeat protein [Crocinitomicaceae bacterium]|nr:tetratricopeptide repeat protein [Crocinitomicaceae bacterium]
MKFKPLGILLIIVAVTACNADKNTFVNRLYHGTTAKYNGLYNANELLYTSLKTYNDNKKEDFFNVLPISSIPNEQEVMALYPAIDTAISKCKRVISLHSMPSIDKPSKKKAEYNPWIDENYIAIGRAMYYRRDFEESIKNFEFVRKFFKEDPSNYAATLWIARNQLQLGELGAAKVNLDMLDAAAEKTEQQQAEAKKGGASKDDTKKKMSKKAKKRAKEKAKREKEKEEKKGLEFVPFPKKLYFDLHLTKGEYFVAKKNYEEAIASLEKSLEYAKKKDKGRVHFIIGQLYEKMKNDTKAAENYTATLKYNTPFEINFAARMNRAMTGGGEKVRKELNKMSRDAKNFEYRDQIFYAIGEMDMRENNRENALKNYNKSIFYSVSNKRQKGRTYERLADINYQDKNYVQAQRYYDSCSKLVDEKYPNYETILNRATKLKKLVESIEIAEYEDSVQRIAKMSPEEQEKFAEKLIKKMKEDAEKEKALALQRQKELTTTGAITSSATGGSKNYFSNQKLKEQGFNDFRKQWGYRQNEDDWRRSDKMSFATFKEDDTTKEDDKKDKMPAQNTGPTAEELLANLPTSDSALEVSNKRYVEARYDAGMIYKEQLNEQALATQQFQFVLDKNFESEFNPMASFQLYRMYENSDPNIASTQRNYILTNYPKTDYAAYLNDPDFFTKRKKIEEIYEQEYLRYLDRYNRGLYYAVLGKAEEVIANEKDNKYRSKYMLIKALCLGQMNNDKALLIPVLEQVKAEYPNTPESARADEMLGIIKNGYSKNEPADFSKKNTFVHSEKGDFWIVIVFDKEQENKILNHKNKIADFSKRYFSKENLVTETKLMGDKNVITVKSTTFNQAKNYVNKFKSSKADLGVIVEADIFYITKENIIKLFEKGNISEYQDFFFEKY